MEGTFPERHEPVETERSPGLTVIRNSQGGVTIIGPVDGDVTFGDQEVVIERHGQRFVLPRRGGRTQASVRETGSSQRERRERTIRNHQRLSPGPDASTGTNQEAKSGQGDEESDGDSDAATLVDGHGTQGSPFHRRDPDDFSDFTDFWGGQNSRRSGTGFRSSRRDERSASSYQINSFTTRGVQINSIGSGGTSNVQIHSVMSGGIANQFNSPHQINYAGSEFQINGVISNFHGDPESSQFDLSNGTNLNINGVPNRRGHGRRR